MTHNKIRLMLGVLSISACGASLAAQAATAPAAATPAKPTLDSLVENKGYKLGKSVDSVPNYEVDGWNTIDRRHLIFTSGPSTSYVLTLQIDCPELSGSDDISFTTTASRLTTQDSVKVEVAGGGIPRTCPIVSINELSRIPKK